MWCVWLYFNQERSKKEYAWVCVSLLLVTANGLFQVVHRIQMWMARKLSSHYKRDTECLNHSTWMMICMRLLYCCDFMTSVRLWCSAARMISFLILNLFYFCKHLWDSTIKKDLKSVQNIPLLENCTDFFLLSVHFRMRFTN